MFETHALVPSLPRLPMLIPCPGPQFTLCMYTFEHPVWIEIQSSPAYHSKWKSKWRSGLRHIVFWLMKTKRKLEEVQTEYLWLFTVGFKSYPILDCSLKIFIYDTCKMMCGCNSGTSGD